MARYPTVVKALICFCTISLLLYLTLLPGFSKYDEPQQNIPSPKRQADHTADARPETDLSATHGYSLTLTIRMAAIPKLVQRLYCIFIRSATLFWSPKLGPTISLILDKESARDHRFARKLRQKEKELGLKFDFLYEPLPDTASGWKPQGYQRQLWSSFFMDLSVNASIIGWTDSDAVFTTPVTPENIFNGHRLRVLTFTDMKRMHKLRWYDSTLKAIGKAMVSDFMTYFPTFVWRDTFTNCRNHIMKHMNVSHFEDAFLQLAHLSPVNIIMNYAYYFEHDRYDWHLDFKKTLKNYNAKLPPGVNIKPSENKPDLHVTIHESYYTKMPYPLLQGYCVAKRYVGTLPTSCQKFENVTNFQLFEFISCKKAVKAHLSPGTWCSGNGRRECIRRIEAHYKNVKKYYNLGWYDLDLRRMTAVEKVARRENITCPNIFQLD
ncbi:uncharacterized protein LOC119731324 isoform X1 [Patiria miniata]|uniref:Uncharacterized protein n=2 Tax=Patiria miniata TaxID=46514 RepID=A0A914A8N9_PATMI|nr:uncharacterized protein LOC119731218 [Patiria miniata]XP_038060405.1 uncharacterized protein LOC119731324 isoform X1 [Patiria miniata]